MPVFHHEGPLPPNHPFAGRQVHFGRFVVPKPAPEPAKPADRIPPEPAEPGTDQPEPPPRP